MTNGIKKTPVPLSKSSCLATALGVAEFIIVIDMIWVTLVALLKPDLVVQQTHL
jgi:hypothetical protein